jgi:hypothetical protein
LAGRGIEHLPSKAWATRVVQYCNRFFAFLDDNRRLIARAPRGMSELRGNVAPEEFARFYFSFEQQVQAMKPRAVRLSAHSYSRAHVLTRFTFADLFL